MTARPTDPSGVGLRSRRRWILAGVGTLVVVLAVTTTLVVTLRGRGGYGPIEFAGSGGTGGSVVGSYAERRLDRSSTEPAYVFSSIDNAGTKPVRVSGIDRSDVITAAAWAPFPDPDDAVFGGQTRWRPFPVTLGHEIVLIRLTVHEPKTCRDMRTTARPVVGFDGVFTVRWRSPSGMHRTTVAGGSEPGDVLGLC